MERTTHENLYDTSVENLKLRKRNADEQSREFEIAITARQTLKTMMDLINSEGGDVNETNLAETPLGLFAIMMARNSMHLSLTPKHEL